MPYLWFVEEESRWRAMPLSKAPVDVGAGVPQPLAPEGFPIHAMEDRRRNAGVICAAGEGPSSISVLVWGPEKTVRVNGWVLTTGLRVLGDKDEIRIGDGTPLFFSSESVAEIQNFPGSEREIFCPRCTLPIEKGKAVVRCPKCQTLHHQDAELGCWTYAEGCAVCAHPTAMDGGFHWRPEETWQ
jgi:hypothetical protein